MPKAFTLTAVVLTAMVAALLAVVNLAFNPQAFRPDRDRIDHIDRIYKLACKVLTLVLLLIVFVSCSPAILALVLDTRWRTRDQSWLDEPLRA